MRKKKVSVGIPKWPNKNLTKVFDENKNYLYFIFIQRLNFKFKSHVESWFDKFKGIII